MATLISAAVPAGHAFEVHWLGTEQTWYVCGQRKLSEPLPTRRCPITRIRSAPSSSSSR